MNRALMWTMTLAAVAGLVALVVVTARAGASGALAGEILTGSPRHGGAPVEASDFTSCGLGDRDGDLVITGVCAGRLPARLTCVVGESTTLIAQVPTRDGRTFTLTITLPDFGEVSRSLLAHLTPGHVADYPARIVAQLSADGGSPRWSERHAVLSLAGTRLKPYATDLEPEPGTPASGTLTLRGSTRAPCLAEQA